MALNPTYRDSFLHWLFKTTTVPAPFASIFFSLHSADPGDTGANELASTGSYARAGLAPDPDSVTNTNYTAVSTTAGTTSIKNLVAVEWPMATGAWNGGVPIDWFSIWDASSGGNWIAAGRLSPAPTILPGSTLRIPIQNFTCLIGDTV